jgi:DNA primase
MDVVALAQHGVAYAVATLGTSTTPVHAQKLFRLTDTVVFCFDGDNAGRKAAWRALENTLPVLADGKNAKFLFLPEGEDPDDFVRKRGKAAFEALVASATPLSESLLAELVAAHPPTSAEGRAALVAAARPHLAQIQAPVLGALLRKRLAELSGLPETELRVLVGATARAEPREAARGPRARRPARRAPSLAHELIQTVLLQPELARSVPLPRPDDATPEGAALTALVDACVAWQGPITTAAVMQSFWGSPHDAVLAAALAAAEDKALTPEQAETELRAGVRRWWQQAGLEGDVEAPADVGEASREETERRRQTLLARKGLAGIKR